MTPQTRLIVEQLVRDFGRPAPRDPARQQLVETLVQRGVLRSGSDVLTLLAPAELVGALADRGAHVTAVEPLEPLLERARQHGPTTSAHVHWVKRDPHRLPFRRAFDLVLAPALVLGVTGREEDDEELLRTMASALRPDGTVVLELPNRDLLIRDSVERVWGEVDGLYVLVHQRWLPMEGSLRVRWHLLGPHGLREPHERSLRLYTASELVQLCRRAGYRTVECWGDDDGSPYDLWSPRLLLVARTESATSEPLVVG